MISWGVRVKIAIFGAGAIGCTIAGMLAQEGFAPSLIARGAQFEALAKRGMTVISDGGKATYQLPVFNKSEDLGPQDFVLVTLKSHALPAALPAISALLGEDTAVVTAQNGIPWWYIYGLPGGYTDQNLESVDKDGKIWRAIGPERALGAVIWIAAELIEPGVVRHSFGKRISLGEPNGQITERVKSLSAALEHAGVDAPVRRNIREDIWLKLWGNLAFNPMSILTGGTLKELAEDADSRKVLTPMMEEAKAIASALGINFSMSIDDRIEQAGRVGDHKTSMLQDLEAGRAIELDALLGSVIELGRLLGHPTPALDMVYHLATIRARVAGCLP